ncbi:hypothetical protein F4823DRAFT_191362 [Ustulina deusta]|nr:hypothetical protein F4823DRAFT_191362 [Ustulina deusta]
MNAMTPTGMGPSSANIRAETLRMVLEKCEGDISDSRIICLRFAAEDKHGYRELQLSKQNLLPVPLSLSQGSRADSLDNSTSPIRFRREIIGRQKDIVYFDFDTMEELELYQTGPLQQVTGITTVAVHWQSFRTREQLKESLMSVYSRLRNIERIIITVDHNYCCAPADSACYRTPPLGFYDMSHSTMLQYESKIVNWCTIGREIQQMIRNKAFWRECNRRYALEQILPIKTNPPRIPQIHLMEVARHCDNEGALRLPTQRPTLMRDLAPDLADIDELRNPEQPEEELAPSDHSLMDLLD